MYKQVSKYFIFTGNFGLADHKGVALYVNFAVSSLFQQFLSTVSNEQPVKSDMNFKTFILKEAI
jgi:hypothetical protein